jgi:phytanoyl-CoA hydroxylase
LEVSTLSLTKKEIKQFHETGYVVKPGVYSQNDLQPIRAAITEMIDAYAHRLQSEGRLTHIFADEPFETRLARIVDGNPGVGPELVFQIGIWSGEYSGPAMFKLLTHPPLLDCIESLIGPDIIGSSVYRIRPKLPDWEKGEVPWHQDAGYSLAHCDRFLIVTCWVPLVDATIENGCLYVLPDANQDGVIRHYTHGHGGYLEIHGDDLPGVKPIPMEMEAGNVLFMTYFTPHASFKNRTDIVRWSVDMRYQDPKVPNNIDESPEDYTPEREPVTMACHPPEADFVIRNPVDPASEVRSPEAFHRIRERYMQNRPRHPGRGWTPLAGRE